MPKSLSHLIDQVPPTNPQSVPDSCDEESSDDEVIQPKPLGGARPGGGALGGYAPSSSSRGPVGMRSGGPPLHTPKSAESRVEASVGRGGKLVYQTVKTGVPAWYYNVQW